MRSFPFVTPMLPPRRAGWRPFVPVGAAEAVNDALRACARLLWMLQLSTERIMLPHQARALLEAHSPQLLQQVPASHAPGVAGAVALALASSCHPWASPAASLL